MPVSVVGLVLGSRMKKAEAIDMLLLKRKWKLAMYFKAVTSMPMAITSHGPSPITME